VGDSIGSSTGRQEAHQRKRSWKCENAEKRVRLGSVAMRVKKSVAVKTGQGAEKQPDRKEMEIAGNIPKIG